MNEEGIFLNNHTLTDEEQEKYYPLDKQVQTQWQIWVPKGKKITNMQIYEAIERGIPMPNGDPEHDAEYRQFLNEHVLEVKTKQKPEDELHPIPPPPTPPEEKKSKDKKEKTIPPEEKESKDKKKKLKLQKIKFPIIKFPIIIKKEQGLEEEPKDKKEKTIPPEEKEPKDKKEKPTPPPPPPTKEILIAIQKELEKDEKNVLVRITEKVEKKLPKPLLIAALTAVLISGLRLEDKIVPKKIAEQLSSNELEYTIENKNSSYLEEVFEETMGAIYMGQEYYLPAGLLFNTNSRMSGDESVKGVTKELGPGKEFSKEGKYPGMYPITGFSIIRKSDNTKINALEDFYEPTSTMKLSDFVKESLKGTGLTYEDIRIEFHFGRTNPKTNERSRLGWLDNGNFILDEESIKKSVENIATYEGVIENFSGDYITIQTQNGPVQIPVKDEFGNYYKPGKIVKGSDGKEYEITSLNEEEKTEIIETTQQIVEGKKLTFDIKNCSLLPAIPFIAAALVDYFRKQKMNRDAQNNPYYKFVSEDEMDEYIDNFQKQASTFKKIQEAITYLGPELEKVIIEAYNTKTSDEVYNIADLMFFEHNNKILVVNKTKKEPKSYDITEEVEMYLSTIINQVKVEGYDIDAAAYFEESRKGRGGH